MDLELPSCSLSSNVPQNQDPSEPFSRFDHLCLAILPAEQGAKRHDPCMIQVPHPLPDVDVRFITAKQTPRIFLVCDNDGSFEWARLLADMLLE
jgi:hypothetical protein